MSLSFLSGSRALRVIFFAAAAVLAAGIFLIPSARASGHEALLDGDLVKRADNPDVFIVKIKNNKYFKRLILNPDIFNSYGHLSWDNITMVSEEVLDEFLDTQLVIEVNPDGTPVTGRVFVLTSEPDTDTGVKHHMEMSAEDFTAAGFDWDGIYFINYTEAADSFYPEGAVRTVTRRDSQTSVSGNVTVGTLETQMVGDGGTLTINGNLTVSNDGRFSVGNNSQVVIQGDLTVEDGGTFACGAGPIQAKVSGNLLIDGDLVCTRQTSDITENDLGLGVVLVVSGSVALSEDSEVMSNGHVIIVDSADKVPATREDIEKLYQDAADDSGTEPRIGPIMPETPSNPVVASPHIQGPAGSYGGFFDALGALGGFFGGLFSSASNPSIYAQVIQDPPPYAGPCFDPVTGVWIPDCTQLSGDHRVGAYPRGTQQILIYAGSDGELRLQDYVLRGPPTPKGDSDLDVNCNARGEDGPDAMRLNGQAPRISIYNFVVYLPHGGDGGDASTPECDDAHAQGGKGGQAANLKLTATEAIDISGDFIIHPGRGGNGGSALALGANKTTGCEVNGGTATAVGGAGADNNKELRIRGAVSGRSLIQIGSMFGGNGGLAVAIGGKGSDGDVCGCSGGAGGDATATGGKGGDARVTMPIDIASTGGAVDQGGDGGDAESYGGNGGDGGDCPYCTNEGPGGTGGDGGDATATEGSGGNAIVPGEDGERFRFGGNGGDGGDGCPPGDGGFGGAGDPPGDDGDPGANTCHDQVGMIGVDIGTATQLVYTDAFTTFIPVVSSDNAVSTYQWYVNDLLVGSSQTLQYAFAAEGTYTLRLVVTDVYGNTGADAAQITAQVRTTAQLDGFFEFFDLNRDWTQVSTLPIPGQVHIIIATDGTPDARTWLPISLTLTSNGVSYWTTTIVNDPVMNCRDATGCSIDGPNLPSNLQGAALVLQARDKNNNLVAEHRQ